MAKYTTEVRTICETLAGATEPKGYNDVEQILSDSWDKVFDFDFPLFDNNYRAALCKKILRHYYTREIGLESYGLWKLKLCAKMNEIMPYMNKLYSSELLEFNPLYTFDKTTTHEIEHGGNDRTVESNTVTSDDTGTITKKDTGNTSHGISGSYTDDKTDAYSDTPEGSLSGVDNNTYLSSYDKQANTRSYNQYEETDTNNLTNTTTLDTTNVRSDSLSKTLTYGSTEEYVEHVTGRENISASKLIKEFRDTFLNIDMMIILELDELFMQLW